MNSPKAPDDARVWDSIDIFVFTNGEEFSPPRKYHLKTEEIKWWDTTLNLLARTQFGSLIRIKDHVTDQITGNTPFSNRHSNIELYTLDGKKINTPLELLNDAAYVGVKPPDSFIQTGYEKYLLKASRSWEKRHDKMNTNEIANSGRENIEMNKEQIKTNLNSPDDGTIIDNGKQMDSLLADTSLRDTESLIETNSYLKTEKPELLQRRKTGSNTKNTILKKIYPNPKCKEDSPNLSKRRTTSFPKNLLRSTTVNNKRLAISSNDTNNLKTSLVEEKVKPKEEPLINVTETKGKSEQLRNDHVIKISPGPSDKDFTVLSDVYKNTESDIQSVFLDADRRTALLSNEPRKVPRVLDNIEELREIQARSIKTTTENTHQSTCNLSEIQVPYNVNQPGTFNINLNIDLKGYTVLKSDDNQGSQENKCKTYVTLMKPEKASQVNGDVNLSREILNFEEEALLREYSVVSGIAKLCEENCDNNIKTKVIVHCKCNLIKSDTSSSCNIKENEHYIIVIPAERNDKSLPRSDLETSRGSCKDIQGNSCIRVPVPCNLEIGANKKSEQVMKHKVSISQEAPKEFNFDDLQLKSQGDTKQTISINDSRVKPNYKIDNVAQTDWCNTLLQAKCHEDGRYTFHLPPLDLLTRDKLLEYFCYFIISCDMVLVDLTSFFALTSCQPLDNHCLNGGSTQDCVLWEHRTQSYVLISGGSQNKN